MSSILKSVFGSQLQLGHRLAQGLVGLWLFNEGSGGQVFDLGGNGNTGILTGTAPSWTSGKFGSAVLLPGTDEHINCGDSDIFSFGDASSDTPFTISCIVRVDNWTTNGVIIAKWDSDNDDMEYYLMQHTTLGLVLDLWDKAETDDYIGCNVSFFTAEYGSKFNHIVVTYDGSGTNTGIKIYINGIEKTPTTRSNGNYVAMHNTISPLLIGARESVDAVSLPFEGIIDHAMLFNRALSASEIALLRREPFCMFERDLIELWSTATLGAPPVGMAGAMTTNTGYWGY